MVGERKRLPSSPFPENIRPTLVFVFSFTFQVQIFRKKWDFLHQSKTKPGESANEKPL